MGREHSTYIITWLSHLGYGWGVGRDHSTCIITWLSHLGFGWGMGRDHSTCIITWLSHLGFGWGGGEGSFFLYNYLTQLGKPLIHSMRLFAHITCCGMGDGGVVGCGGVRWGVCDNVLLLLAQRPICYTMSRSSLAPANQHDLTLSHFLLTLSSTWQW